MNLPPKPTLEFYLTKHASYQQFICLLILFSVVVAWNLARHNGRGLAIGVPVWRVILLALALRLPLLVQDFWYDEAFTSAVVTTASWSDMWIAIAGDVHPPLYYAIVRVFVGLFGASDVVMRLPALLSSLALVVTMYHIGRLHGGQRVGEYAALLTALLPAAVYYGAEARYPSFLALTLSLAYIGVLRRHNVLIALSLVVAALSHVNAWFYVLLMLAYHISTGTGGRWWTAIPPVTAIAAWLPVAVQQAGDVADGFWLQQSTVLRYIVDMTVTGRFDTVSAAIVPITLTVALLAVSVWRWRRRVSWLWLALVAGVPAVQWFVGVVWHPIYLERTMLFSALLLLVPVACWLDRHASVWLASVGVLCFAFAIASIYQIDRSGFDQVIAQCGDDSQIYATNTHTAILASHYADVPVTVFSGGNSTAQQLPDSARRILFKVTNQPEVDSCVLSQVDSFNSDIEMNHIRQVTTGDRIVMQSSQYVYYVIE